jgi:hypothetical protein
MTVVGGTSDYPQVCGRPYDEHELRPALPPLVLDRTPMPLNKFGFAEHRAGCATLCEVLGICSCGMIEFNVSRITWLLESQLAVGLQMAEWPHKVADSVPSTEFRTSYAGLEHPTDVTVNGRVIGRWVPVHEPV